jgi:hypothetical protein
LDLYYGSRYNLADLSFADQVLNQVHQYIMSRGDLINLRCAKITLHNVGVWLKMGVWWRMLGNVLIGKDDLSNQRKTVSNVLR